MSKDLSVALAAKKLRVSEQRVRKWLDEGRLPGRRLWGTSGPWIIPAATCRKPAPKRPGPKTVAETQ